uniref:Uncharacterized protein n=1 Tax=Arundo donax TaxID=35708 RepID=A0A0A9BU80_ARUDO
MRYEVHVYILCLSHILNIRSYHTVGYSVVFKFY